MRILPLSSRGFTLVELMMALLLTMVGVVGLLKSIEVATEHNLRNQLRDQAVFIGEKVMASQKVRPFDQISSSTVSTSVNGRQRSGNVSYTVERSSTFWPAVNPTAKQLIVKVRWNYRGSQYTHEVRSVRSQ